MKQFLKNFGSALFGLVGKEKFMPLSKQWIEMDKKELEREIKARELIELEKPPFRPAWMKKINTIAKNSFKTEAINKERVEYINTLINQKKDK